MTVENSETIVITHCFDFSIERVFDAWLDPARARLDPSREGWGKIIDGLSAHLANDATA